MNVKSLLATAGVVAVTLGAASTASAQAAAPPAVTHGPPIANICIFSPEAAIRSSTVGKYITSRLQQIEAQVNAELTSEQTALENENKTLQAQRGTLDQATFQTRGVAFNAKADAFQRKFTLRQREMAATEQKAVNRVGADMNPLIFAAYQRKSCSILLNGAAVITANSAMDLTSDVVTALNAKITQFPFDRERLDQAAAPAPAKK